MRKSLLICLLLISSFAAFAQKVTLGIMDLAARQGVSAGDAGIVTEFIFSAVYEYGRDQYNIIAREQREALLAEQKFTLSGLCDEVSCAVEVGKYLSAEYMIVGSFTKFGSKYYITLQLVSVRTTAVTGSSRIDAADYDGLMEELEPGIRRLLGIAGADASQITQVRESSPPSAQEKPDSWTEISSLPDWLIRNRLFRPKIWYGPSGRRRLEVFRWFDEYEVSTEFLFDYETDEVRRVYRSGNLYKLYLHLYEEREYSRAGRGNAYLLIRYIDDATIEVATTRNWRDVKTPSDSSNLSWTVFMKR